MKSEGSIKQEIGPILERLSAKENKAGGLGCVVWFLVAGLLAALGVLIFQTEVVPTKIPWVIGTVAVVLLVSFVSFGAVYNSIFEPAAKLASSEYDERFPPNSPDRKAADQVLAKLEEPGSAQLRTAVGVESEQEVERERQEREAERKLDQAAKAFEIASSFQCGACGATVSVERLGQSVTCAKCKKTLRMPWRIECPSCAADEVQVVSADEQVRKDDKGKLAGTLMYGPAGWIAGAILDEVKDAVVGDALRSFKKPRLRCGNCGRTWAIKIPAG